MQIVVLVTKEDVQTIKIGTHYQIKISECISINFTKDAIEELYNDMIILEKENNNNNT